MEEELAADDPLSSGKLVFKSTNFMGIGGDSLGNYTSVKAEYPEVS